MAEEKRIVRTQHNVIMEGRKNLIISGVMDMDSFDEQTVIAFTELGELTIRGINLHINKIDIDTGELMVEGEIDSLTYSQGEQKKGGFFTRLLR